MSHYYTNDYTLSNKQKFKFTYREKEFIFNTDSNVFSKSEVDFGSLFLVDTVLNDVNLVGNVLDLGCGYGALSILLAKFSSANFVGCDVNERAVDLCNENAIENNLKNIKVVASDVAQNVTLNDFDYVVSNPPIRAGNVVLFKFFEQAYQKLKNEGVAYWVFRKQQGAETYTNKLKNVFKCVEIVDKKKSFWIVKCIK